MDEPTIEHDFQRTIPSDGLWCQRCGLSHALWVGEPCAGRIHPSVEAKIVDLRERAEAAESRATELESALRECLKLCELIDPEDDDDADLITEVTAEARALLPPANPFNECDLGAISASGPDDSLGREPNAV